MEGVLCPAVFGIAVIWSRGTLTGVFLGYWGRFCKFAYLPKGGLYLRISVDYLHRFRFICILSLFIVLINSASQLVAEKAKLRPGLGI
jgi:hypothetical protein